MSAESRESRTPKKELRPPRAKRQRISYHLSTFLWLRIIIIGKPMPG